MIEAEVLSAAGCFGFAPDAENPGWMLREAVVTGEFVDVFGPMRARVEGIDRVRVRTTPGRQHRNPLGFVHGGFLLALVDQSLFVAPACHEIAGAVGGVTVDCATQFLSPAKVDEPLDVVVETLRETGRLVFMRGLIEQADVRVLAFSGTIRKATART